MNGRLGACQLINWARLFSRVFERDLEDCLTLGGELKIIAAILDQPFTENMLTHLGLQACAQPRTLARGHALLHAARAHQTHDSSLGPAP